MATPSHSWCGTGGGTVRLSSVQGKEGRGGRSNLTEFLQFHLADGMEEK